MSLDLAPLDHAARPSAAGAVQRHPAGEELEAGALADLVCAPRSELANRAQAALRPLVPHDALVLVTPGSPASSVQVAASPNLSERLAGAEWSTLCGRVQLAHGEACPLDLPDVVGGLRISGWAASAEGCEVALIVGATAPLTLGPRQERAALQVALLAAARLRSLDVDPAPGTLGFVRAVSAERERIRADLSSRHSATLSSLLHTLRAATAASGLRNAPAGVAQAIDLASEALMELRASADHELAATQVALQAVYDEVATEARGLAQLAGLRLVAGLDDPEGARVDSSIAQAGRLVTRAAADMRGDRLCARTVAVRLRDWDFKTRSAQRTLPDPVVSDRVILRVAHELLRTLRNARRVPARLVGVRLSGLALAAMTDQLAIVSEETERDRGLSRAIDRVRGRFGPKSIVPGGLAERLP